MSSGLRILLVALGIGAVGLPFLASPRGWGMATEKSTKILLANKDCPPEKRDKNGNCPVKQNHRSRYSRSSIGGGTGTGK